VLSDVLSDVLRAVHLTCRARLRVDGGQVAAVAGAVGYESEAAFSRAFKTLVGQAPATWRRGSIARS